MTCILDRMPADIIRLTIVWMYTVDIQQLRAVSKSTMNCVDTMRLIRATRLARMRRLRRARFMWRVIKYRQTGRKRELIVLA